MLCLNGVCLLLCLFYAGTRFAAFRSLPRRGQALISATKLQSCNSSVFSLWTFLYATGTVLLICHISTHVCCLNFESEKKLWHCHAVRYCSDWKRCCFNVHYAAISDRMTLSQFLPRCMECARGLAMRKSVFRLSVKRVNCDKTEERSVQIFIPYETSFILVFWEEEWLVGGYPIYLKFCVNWPPLEPNRRFSTDICP